MLRKLIAPATLRQRRWRAGVKQRKLQNEKDDEYAKAKAKRYAIMPLSSMITIGSTSHDRRCRRSRSAGIRS
jgi:hypothetical protein